MWDATRARALVCLNLRKEWASDQIGLAAALERQAWCLDQARQSGWSVFHAQAARRTGLDASERGALRGLTPLREEPVFVLAHRLLLDNGALRDALRACGAECAHVVGIGQLASLACDAESIELRVIKDAFVEVGAVTTTRVRRVGSVSVFATDGGPSLGGDIVDLGAWRRKTSVGEGAN